MANRPDEQAGQTSSTTSMIATLANQINSGQNSGLWTGSGLTSTSSGVLNLSGGTLVINGGTTVSANIGGAGE